MCDKQLINVRKTGEDTVSNRDKEKFLKGKYIHVCVFTVHIHAYTHTRAYDNFHFIRELGLT